jgi:hypothetical protein
MSAAVKELLTPYMKVTSIMMPTSQQEFTDLHKSFADARIDMRRFEQQWGMTVSYIQYMINLNSVSFPPTSKYTGNNRAKDLLVAVLELKKAVSPLQNNTAVKLPPPPPPGWKPPPPPAPQPVTSISELLSKLDDIIKLLGGDPATAAATNAADLQKKTASAAAAQVEMNKKTASAAAAAQVEMIKKTASAAAAAAATESRRLTASAAAAAESQRRTASAAAAAAATESRRLTASAATAAAAKAEMDKKTASAAAVAAEQQRISGTLSSLSSSLQAVKSTLQAGGSASAPRASPIEAAIGAANTLYKTVNPSRVPNSVKRAVGSAMSELRNLQTKQRTVASKLNAAVKAINAVAAKKGGSRKNNFTRTRKGGSRSKRTRSRSRN